MSTLNIDKCTLPAQYIPGQIYHSRMPNFVDPADLLLLDQESVLKAMMRKSGGMTGDRTQTPGIFQRMISYAYMPVLDMQRAVRNQLDEGQQRSIKGYVDLVTIGLRLSESTVDSWIGGFGGIPPNDIPPVLKDEYLYEKALWAAKETQYRGVLQHPSDEMKQWMDNLGLTFGMLEEALVNPFGIDADPFRYVSSDVMLRMRDLGLFALKTPKKYGGQGLNQREYDKVIRALVKTMSGTIGASVGAHCTLGSSPLVMFGTETQKELYLHELAKGIYLCAFALTERGSGTDAIDSAGTIAKKVGDKYILNGTKTFITNAHRAGLMFTFAKIDDGSGELTPAVFIVDLPFRNTDSRDLMNAKRKILAKGELGELTSEEKRAMDEANLSSSEKRALNQEGKIILSNPLDLMMIRGSIQAYIEFKDFTLPVKKDIDSQKVESILGGNEGIGQGAKQIFNSLNSGRAGFGSFCAEAASAALDLAVIEAVQRGRFAVYGGRLADLPKVKEYISEAAVRSYALNATAKLTTHLIDTYPNMNIIAEAAAIKAFATEEAWGIVPAVARIFGGAGTMKGFPVELMFRDMWIPLIVEGVNEALKQHLVLVSARPAMKAQKALKGNMDGIKEAWKIIKGNLHFEKGDLSFWDAHWVKRQTERLSRRALILGMVHGTKTALQQKEILKIADRAIGLYAACAVLLRLQELSEPQTLKEKAEKLALEQYIMNAKSGKNEYPEKIANLLIDDAMIRVGEMRAENDRLVKSQAEKLSARATELSTTKAA